MAQLAQTPVAADDALLLVPLLGITPAVAWLVFLYTRDRYEREPKKLIAKLFLIGALPVIFLAGIVNTMFNSIVGMLLVVIVIAPVVEEILKYLGLRIGTRNAASFNEPVDGMIYGSTVGLGFAAAENLDYITRGLVGTAGPGCFGLECAVSIGVMRGLGTTLMHGTVAGIAGYGAARIVVGKEKSSAAVSALAGAIALHAFFNLATNIGAVGVIVGVAVSTIVYFRLLKDSVERSPFRAPKLVPPRVLTTLAPGMAAASPAPEQPGSTNDGPRYSPFCPNCGTATYAGARFCQSCGGALPPA